VVEYVTEELQVDGQSFPFQLCRKAVHLSRLAVNHWWMDTRLLDGQRNRPAPNSKAITSYFWALCERHGTAQDAEVQESFILARLLPLARSHASRRVFADAHLTRPECSRSSREEMRAELEALLRSSRQDSLSMVDFKNRTADILGPPILSPEVQSRYLELTEEFLGDARAALIQKGTPGLQVAISRWQEMMRTVGRRAGMALEKQVLDILSYECRAAFHRCYSAVWWDLIPRLTLKYDLNLASQHFLHFWHLDHCESAQEPRALFHLFHGHIFALHPAGGALLQTPTGRIHLGAWLQEPESETAFGQLLHALFVTLHHYVEQREVDASSRRK
jgi:hypothetical protein